MSDGEKDLYSVLGVAPDAPPDVIKAAYRTLAKQYHPDLGGVGVSDATDRFIELQEAYKIISNSAMRREYDESHASRDESEFRTDTANDPTAQIDPEEVWMEVEATHPKIRFVYDNLLEISVALANRYRIAIINGECGDKPLKFGRQLRDAFLTKYFGNSPDVHRLALRLLRAGRRDVAKELNLAVKNRLLDSNEEREKYIAELDRRYLRPDAQHEHGADAFYHHVGPDTQLKRTGNSRVAAFGAFFGALLIALIIYAVPSYNILHANNETVASVANGKTGDLLPAHVDNFNLDLVTLNDANSQAGTLISRGDHLMTLGDITEARRFYLQALDAGAGPTVLMQIGMTFDPVVFATNKIMGISPDAEKALGYYRQAESKGVTAATNAISSLEAWRKSSEANASMCDENDDCSLRERSLGKRVALVIGNSNYQHNSVLRNPSNDAKAIAETLEKLGFKVIEGIDQTQETMKDLIQNFSQEVDQSEAALFFYAGHSIQKDDLNYLIPVDADIQNETDISLQTIPLGVITDLMIADERAAIAFIDACRDNPLARSTRLSDATRSSGLKVGLAPLQQGGLLIGYATAPGAVAQDGDGEHSPFTAALLKHITTEGIEVQTMLTRVRVDVKKATDDQQIPWSNSAMYGEFYFVPTENLQADQSKTEEMKKVSLPDASDPSGDAGDETIVDILSPSVSKKKIYNRILGEVDTGGQMVPTEEQPSPVEPLPTPQPDNSGMLPEPVAPSGQTGLNNDSSASPIPEPAGGQASGESMPTLEPFPMLWLSPSDRPSTPPKPRPKPIEILMQGASLMTVEPPTPLVLVSPDEPLPPPAAAESIAPSAENVAVTTTETTTSSNSLFGTGAKKLTGKHIENTGSTAKAISNSQQAITSAQDQVASIDTPQRTTSSALQAEPAPKTMTASSGGTSYVAQIASLRSEAEARAELDRVRGSYGDLIGTLSTRITKTTVAGTTRYRLGFGPLPSRSEAAKLCSSLIAAGERDCTVRGL